MMSPTSLSSRSVSLAPLRLAGVVLLALLPGASAAADGLAITNVTVIDPASGSVTEGQAVQIADGRIASVSDAATFEPTASSRLIDGTGQFLLPGFWDMHTHLDGHTETDLAMLVAHGVLNVRDMGGDPFVLADLKARTASGELLGPTIRGAGAILEDRAWLTRARGIFPELAHRVPVDNPAEARATIALLASWGVDLVKVRNLTDEATLRAILDAAKAHGLTVAGHEPMIVDIDRAAELGMTTFEHVPFITLTMPGKEADEARIAAAIALLRDTGAFLDPTLIASNGLGKSRDERQAAIDAPDERYQYLPRSVKQSWLESLEGDAGPLPWGPMRERSIEILRQMVDAGIPVVTGTDMGVPLTFPGSSLLEEIELLVRQAGLAPMVALRAATSAPASVFDLAEGSIAAGQTANLVLLSADPLESIANVRSIEGVVLRGEILDRQRLDGILEQVRRNKDATPSDSLFARMERACRADPGPECLRQLAGYHYSALRYAEARATYQEALDLGAGSLALEGLFASTLNLLFSEELACDDASPPVEALLAAHSDDPDRTVGVLSRILPALADRCSEARNEYLGRLAALQVDGLSDEMRRVYREYYASYLAHVAEDGAAAYAYRVSGMPEGWEADPLLLEEVATLCLTEGVALSEARGLAQRIATVTEVPILRLQAMMLEARIASATGDHQAAVTLMETIDRAVPDNATVQGLLESFRELAESTSGGE